MKQRRLFSLLATWGISTVLLGCGLGEEQKSQTQSPSWTLQMSLVNGEKVTDHSSASSRFLFEQLNTIKPARAFFLDPQGYAETPGLMSARLTARGQILSQSFFWTPVVNVRTQFGDSSGCTSTPGVSYDCEYQPLLNCLRRQAAESAAASTPEGEQYSGQSRSLLLEWSRRCGAGGVFASDLPVPARFTIQNGQVLFEPSPVLSVLIYSGVWASYEDAVVQAATVASLPAVVPCSRSDGACLASPVPVSSCLGCSGLQKGQLYTVFFVETLRQDYSSMKSTVFVP